MELPGSTCAAASHRRHHSGLLCDHQAVGTDNGLSNLLRGLVTRYFDPAAIRVVSGGVDETTKLLELRFNHVFLTDSANVGRHVSVAAAKHLTPVTLELGGQCPAIIGKLADLERAAKAIAYAKFPNAGQICLSVNHALVDPAVHDEFVEKLQYWSGQFLHAEWKTTTAIVNQRHLDRLTGLLQQTNGKIVCGGIEKDELCRMEPIVVTGLDMKDPLLAEEIFGTICPVLKSDVRQACYEINKNNYPLALCIFISDKSEIQGILGNINSGGITINDVTLHASFPGAHSEVLEEVGMATIMAPTGSKLFRI